MAASILTSFYEITEVCVEKQSLVLCFSLYQLSEHQPTNVLLARGLLIWKTKLYLHTLLSITRCDFSRVTVSCCAISEKTSFNEKELVTSFYVLLCCFVPVLKGTPTFLLKPVWGKRSLISLFIIPARLLLHDVWGRQSHCSEIVNGSAMLPLPTALCRIIAFEPLTVQIIDLI